MGNIANGIIKLAIVCIAADIIYEVNAKHNFVGKVKAKFKKK
jgi:hypothetical protein